NGGVREIGTRLPPPPAAEPRQQDRPQRSRGVQPPPLGRPRGRLDGRRRRPRGGLVNDCCIAFLRGACDNKHIPHPFPRRSAVSHLSRRSFLKCTAAGGGFLMLPAATYRAALLAQEKPSETVRVGSIGVGGQGTSNMNAIKKNVVAVCDVDKSHAAAAAA